MPAPIPNPGPCNVPLSIVNGTGENTVAVPGDPGSQYKSITEQLLYEIWQTLLLILAGSGGLPVTKIVSFTIGDGQAGTPANGTTSLVVAGLIQGQSLTDKNLLVIRNGIELKYSTGVSHNDIIRLNTTGVSGGFEFDAAGSALDFENGDVYDIYVVGINTSNAP
jgi:hypothetical protein